jgi:putative permease
MKRLATLTAVAAATLLLIGVLWQLRGVVVLFLLSLAVAAALRPLVDRLTTLGRPRGIALVLVYVLALGLLVVAAALVGPLLVADLRKVADTFMSSYDWIWAHWPSGTPFQQAIVKVLPAPEDLYGAVAGPRGEAILESVLGLTASVFGAASQLAIVLVMSVYWGLDQARFERLWLAALPAEQRGRARDIWRAIETGTGAYIRSEVLQSLLAAALLGLGYWFIGLPYPVLLASIGAVAWLVPWLGALLALLPVIAVGWPAGLGAVVLAALYTTVVFIVLEFAVQPRIYARREYSALLIVLVMLALGDAFGLIGVVLGPPLAAALQILLTELLAAQTSPEAPGLEEQYRQLEERLKAVRQTLAAAQEPPSPQMISMVDRLEALVNEAGTALRESGHLGGALPAPTAARGNGRQRSNGA